VISDSSPLSRAGDVPCSVHDQSASRRDVFIEPLAVRV